MYMPLWNFQESFNPRSGRMCIDVPKIVLLVILMVN